MPMPSEPAWLIFLLVSLMAYVGALAVTCRLVRDPFLQWLWAAAGAILFIGVLAIGHGVKAAC